MLLGVPQAPQKIRGVAAVSSACTPCAPWCTGPQVRNPSNLEYPAMVAAARRRIKKTTRRRPNINSWAAAGVFLIVLRAAATIAGYSRFEGFLTWGRMHHEAQGVHVDDTAATPLIFAGACGILKSMGKYYDLSCGLFRVRHYLSDLRYSNRQADIAARNEPQVCKRCLV